MISITGITLAVEKALVAAVFVGLVLVGPLGLLYDKMAVTDLSIKITLITWTAVAIPVCRYGYRLYWSQRNE
jgi:hypothetical protein